MPAIPSFVIIGAQKSGTTAAARNLSLHPEIQVFAGTTEYGQQEIEFFNQHWERGSDWYASHFQGGVILNGEKTAELLHRTICHERMYAVNPHFKLIVLLRSPVDRAYSQWKMASLMKGDETVGFEELVERELATLQERAYRERFYNCHDNGITCWREGYLLKGMYAEQLQSVFKWFPKEQVFVGISEQIRSDLIAGYGKIFDFLGVSPFNGQYAEHFMSRPAAALSKRMRSSIEAIYRRPNEDLCSLLGMDIPDWR